MITTKNVQTIQGQRTDLTVSSVQNIILDASHLLLMPALIDPHVHFRTPGAQYKEDWISGAHASLHGGYTTVLDMPNNDPPTLELSSLMQKKALIAQQLESAQIPLRYGLYLGADKRCISDIARCKDHVVGIKIFMGCSTGGLLIDDDETLQAVFYQAAQHNLLVAVHAEDEARIQSRKKITGSYRIHSRIRDAQVACIAVAKAINLARRYGTRLYLLHVSTEQEIELIARAKQEGLPIFAEATPHHLFLNQSDYADLQGRAIMNPPLRTQQDQQALIRAIKERIIDTIGSDHAPHTRQEKEKPYGLCPAGIPGIETTLPLLLTAYHQSIFSLEQIVDLTSKCAQEIFNLPTTQDYVLVDLMKERLVRDDALHTKCAWSPFSGRLLRGWPTHVILRGQLYDLNNAQKSQCPDK